MLTAEIVFLSLGGAVLLGLLASFAVSWWRSLGRARGDDRG